MSNRSARPKTNGNGRNEMSAADWAAAINAAWQNAVESIIETGRLLIEAKAALRHGEWGQMVETLPFGLDTAGALMRIADNSVLSNSEFIRNLPPSWGTLYEMTKLPEEELERLIAAGKITGETRRRDVVEIRKQTSEEGLYLYERVPEALCVLIKYMRRWPDGAAFACNLEMEVEGTPDVDDLPPLCRWIEAIHAAYVEERARQDRLADEQEEQERTEIEERVSAMSDTELRVFAEDTKTPPTDRAIAMAEGRRRDLTFEAPSNKRKKHKGRRPRLPLKFNPSRRSDGDA